MSSTFQTWSLAPELPAIGDNEVHVWRVSLDPPAPIVGLLRPLLSADEKARADRFHFKIDSQRFTVARACLRAILGRYLQMDGAKIEFDYAEHGKPHLTPLTEEPSQLKFNLAHSHGLALYAFTRGREIGVDLERIRPELASEGIAHRFFSAIEIKLLDEVPADVRDRAFFNCWTRKEAFIKAKGVGLSLPLDQFDVTLAPSSAAVLLRTRWDESEALRWSLQTVDVGADYVAAIAVEGQHWRLSCWQPDEKFFNSACLQTKRATGD